MGNPSWEVHNLKKGEYILFLPEFSATNTVMWKFHAEESINSGYDMILVRDLLTELGLDIKFSDNTIIGGEVLYEGYLSTMVDISNYDFKYITDKIVKPEESFINLYVDECLEYDSTISSTRRMRIILDVKYKNPI